MHELTRLANYYGTDKGSEHNDYIHCYTEFYGPLLNHRRNNLKNMLEIGVYEGQSLRMWKDFFVNANIYGIDCDKVNIKEERLFIGSEINAYIEETVNIFKDKNIKFDFIIDDGPHNMSSWTFVLNNYIDLLDENGIFIIEDIDHIDKCYELIDTFSGDKNRLTPIDRTKTAINIKNRRQRTQNGFNPNYILLYM
jgi:hypothetical protein